MFGHAFYIGRARVRRNRSTARCVRCSELVASPLRRFAVIGAALIGEDGVRDVTTAPRNDAAAVAIGGKSWPLDIRLRPWVFRPRTDLLPMAQLAGA